MPVDRSIPLAIVIAGGAIAAGLYFGLREQGRAREQMPAPAQVLAPTSAQVPVSARAQVASEGQVLQQAVESLAYQRALLRARCYQPALAQQPGMTMALRFDVTFDGQGREVTRGVIEEQSTSALTSCVTQEMTPLRVPAPGGVVRVEVPLRFP